MVEQPTTVQFPQPSIGRIVHFFSTMAGDQSGNVGEGPYAAIVVEIEDQSGRYGTVTLRVLGPGGDLTRKGVLYKDAKADDAAAWWEWPPRV